MLRFSITAGGQFIDFTTQIVMEGNACSEPLLFVKELRIETVTPYDLAI